MKRGRPVLYELMGSRHVAHEGAPETNGHVHTIEPIDEPPDPEPAPSPAPPPAAATPAHVAQRLFGPGRSIRIPTGYIFIAGAALIVIAAVTYMFGFSRGREDERTRFEDDSAILDETSRIAGAQTGSVQHGARTEGSAPWQAEPSSTQRWGLIESDPRRAGFNYYTLIHTSHDNAVRVAEFCREHGLEAYVVRAKDDTFRVFAVPGFAAGESDSPEIAALAERIDEVRTRWRAHFGRDELDRFPQKFGG